jgi:hypothetical protein
MRSWVQTWSELLKNERGAQVKKILDNVFPKRRVVVAQAIIEKPIINWM